MFPPPMTHSSWDACFDYGNYNNVGLVHASMALHTIDRWLISRIRHCFEISWQTPSIYLDCIEPDVCTSSNSSTTLSISQTVVIPTATTVKMQSSQCESWTNPCKSVYAEHQVLRGHTLWSTPDSVPGLGTNLGLPLSIPDRGKSLLTCINFRPAKYIDQKKRNQQRGHVLWLFGGHLENAKADFPCTIMLYDWVHLFESLLQCRFIKAYQWL